MSSQPMLFSPLPVRTSAVMLSPQPVRDLDLLLGASPAPQTPCKKTTAWSTHSTPSTNRGFWFDGSDTEGESSAQHVLPDWLPAFGQDGARKKPHTPSVASTMTPGLDDLTHSPPFSPELSLPSATPDKGLDLQSPVRCHQPMASVGGQDVAAAQVRKIFVGGIPKNIDQHQLRVFFNTFGKVQKAWLQYVRYGQSPTVKEHRGFGFVVFSDERSVENLLCGEFSRFVKLENGPRVEVKRAVGNNDMEEPESSVPALRGNNHHGREGARRKATSVESFSACARNNDACELRAVHARAGSENVFVGEITSPPLSNCGHTCASFPFVPPLPIDSSSENYRLCENYPGHADTFGSLSCGNPYARPPYVPPFPIPAQPLATNWQSACSSYNSSPVESSMGSPCAKPFDILFDGFVGKMPGNSQELAFLLAQAMPDHYDD